jgi:hypothetical protein
MYDSGKVSLEHLLLSWYPSQQGVLPESQGQNLTLTVLYVPYSLYSSTEKTLIWCVGGARFYMKKQLD